MIVLGVDPGSSCTGYGIVESKGNRYRLIDYGAIRPKRTEILSQKRQLIFEGISQLMVQYPVDAISVETQYVRRNPQTAIKLGMVRGVIILSATMRDIPVFEYAPSSAKLAVTGNGGAGKAQVQGMVQRLMNLTEPPEPEDAADALALAICHIHSASTKNLGALI